MYPLRFDPIFQYRIWGGRRLASLLSAPLPGDGPIGEAWLLSDRDDYPSLVADGPLTGRTIAELMKEQPQELLGKLAGRFDRFPLLLKFLDARTNLSVQVHPSDEHTEYLPAGESGKTEAWVVLESGPESRIYAGLKPNTTPEVLRQGLANGTVADSLASFKPKVGDGILLEAGTVHTFGDLVVFEVQENSDVTFRLYDWDHVDPTTGKPRQLQIEQAMACIDYSKGPQGPSAPVIEATEPVLRERLFVCTYFILWRLHGASPFSVGALDAPRLLVCLDGNGALEHDGTMYNLTHGDVFLLPAVIGPMLCHPERSITLLEIALP